MSNKKKAETAAATPPHFTIGISTSALFDMRESDKIFRTKGADAYKKHMIKNEDTPFAPGHAFALLETMRDINKAAGYNMFTAVLISRNNAYTGARAVASCYHYELPVQSAMFSNGTPVVDYLPAYDVDWFISTNKDDVETAAKNGLSASMIDSPVHGDHALQMALRAKKPAAAKPPVNEHTPLADGLTRTFNKKLQFVLDLDRVVYGSESDQFFTDHGLPPYLQHEKENARIPLSDGPFMPIVKKITEITRLFPANDSPVGFSVITARSSLAKLRSMLSAREKDILDNGAWHLIANGGERKARVLEVMKRDESKTIVFLDDSAPTIDHTKKLVMSGLVPKIGGGLALGEKCDDKKPQPK